MMSACAGTDRRTGTSEGLMATSSWGALLSPPGVSYAFPQVLPQRLDELLSSVPQP